MASKGWITGIMLILTFHLRMTSTGDSSADIITTYSSTMSSDVTDLTTPSVNTPTTFNMTTPPPSNTVFTTSYTVQSSMVMTNDSNRNSTSKISCRTFTCNSFSCYSMYLNMTASPCSPDALYCELRRLDNATLSVNCSTSCNATFNRCENLTQTGCSVNCCNTTDCLNSTLSLVASTTTVSPSTMVTTQTTPTTLTSTIRNAKKCYGVKCQGEKCYQTDPQRRVIDCPVGQDFCQLKRTISGTITSWEAGCGGNCMANKPCTSTSTDCTQECCNATTASSCLKLDGSLNMPNAAMGLSTALSFLSPWLVIWALGLCLLIG